jgi:hypothetical protein
VNSITNALLKSVYPSSWIVNIPGGRELSGKQTTVFHPQHKVIERLRLKGVKKSTAAAAGNCIGNQADQ